jgi:hypothetical protein
MEELIGKFIKVEGMSPEKFIFKCLRVSNIKSNIYIYVIGWIYRYYYRGMEDNRFYNREIEIYMDKKGRDWKVITEDEAIIEGIL